MLAAKRSELINKLINDLIIEVKGDGPDKFCLGSPACHHVRLQGVIFYWQIHGWEIAGDLIGKSVTLTTSYLLLI